MFLSVLAGCMPSGERGSTPVRPGAWHAELQLGDQVLPFNIELIKQGGHLMALILNGGEELEWGEVVLRGDSVTIRSTLYEPVFRGALHGDSLIDGTWAWTSKGEPHHVPLAMRAGRSDRFTGAHANAPSITGSWEVHFGATDSTAGEPATGLFDQHDGIVTGTFATETGDYRYLEGVLRNDSLLLSGFDGGHAYLFAAAAQGDTLQGTLYSGPVHREQWVAVRNAAWHLRDPDSLSTVVAYGSPIDLRFTTIDGKSVGTADAQRTGKVVLLQVMGSWCANCMDEAVLFNELYAQHHAQGLEVIALGFEKNDDTVASVRSLERFRQRLNIGYPIVHAGCASAADVRTALPMLKDFMSFPTSIVLDRKGRVRRVHTGFYGPGTGEHYVRFKKEFEGFLEELLREDR